MQAKQAIADGLYNSPSISAIVDHLGNINWDGNLIANDFKVNLFTLNQDQIIQNPGRAIQSLDIINKEVNHSYNQMSKGMEIYVEVINRERCGIFITDHIRDIPVRHKSRILSELMRLRN